MLLATLEAILARWPDASGSAARYDSRAVDSRAHKRYLEYLEKLQYFARPGLERLTREKWVMLDAELAPLREKQARGVITAAELARLVALRRILLVD